MLPAPCTADTGPMRLVTHMRNQQKAPSIIKHQHLLASSLCTTGLHLLLGQPSWLIENRTGFLHSVATILLDYSLRGQIPTCGRTVNQKTWASGPLCTGDADLLLDKGVNATPAVSQTRGHQTVCTGFANAGTPCTLMGHALSIRSRAPPLLCPRNCSQPLEGVNTGLDQGRKNTAGVLCQAQRFCPDCRTLLCRHG